MKINTYSKNFRLKIFMTINKKKNMSSTNKNFKETVLLMIKDNLLLKNKK